MKTLEQKLAVLSRDNTADAFILADAKDADMAFGLSATGIDRATGKPRTVEQYRDQMRQIVRQGLVDIMLMSCSNSYILTIEEGLFQGSSVTPAIRANDTTDIHLMTGGTYAKEPSRPFSTCTLEQAQSGKVNPTDAERRLGANLGLYSITPNNALDFDYPTLLAYKEFRNAAERVGFHHFLEVFSPNACGDRCPADLARFTNDLIIRTLAGVPKPNRPVFLKVVYHGPAAMEQLAGYDRSMIVGIMGGSAGTSFDAFHQLIEARKYGARAALYGRMINQAEDQPSFVKVLRLAADGQITDPAEAVKLYHAELAKVGVTPARPLADDLQPTKRDIAYARSGSGTAVKVDGAAQKKTDKKDPVAEYRARWNRILG
jgi:hypothetical protein